MMTSMIWVTFQKEGIHKYPEAATNPKLKDVSFLGNEHRHIFHFKVWISVLHNNRNIEFILFKRWLESLYQNNVLQLDFKSCEMMAEDLYEKIHEEYPDRDVFIEISEDGENGCYMEWRN